MSVLEALLLGLVQGITEFFPISSSGHLLIMSRWFEIPASQNLLVILSLHLATCMSIFLVFYKDIVFLVREVFQFRYNTGTRFFLKILLAAVPIILVGLFFEEHISLLFAESSVIVAAMLFVTALLLLWSHLKTTKIDKNQKEIGYIGALAIGVAQCLAILPGLSRSGATISIGIILGCNKKEVTRFSFLILLLPVLGASSLKFFEYFTETDSTAIFISPLVLSVSFFSAFVSGYFCCKLMRYAVLHSKIIYFAIYCFLISFILFLSI